MSAAAPGSPRWSQDPSFRWIEQHGRTFAGLWVALQGERCVAFALTLRSLNALLARPPKLTPTLIHKCPKIGAV